MSIAAVNTKNKQRSSNLELYRIICMLMIVAHHYVVNSGLIAIDGPLLSNPKDHNSLFLLLFGAWGKTGINCFLMITGYFMCTSQITLRKFLKLLLQIYLYKFIIFFVFLLSGNETVSPTRILELAMPFWSIKDDFVGCFIVFYLTIPFWNILIKNMTKKQHQLLLLLLLVCYTLLGTVPTFTVSFNYVTWFGIIYLIASYIRLYPSPLLAKRAVWGWLTVISVFVSLVSIIFMVYYSSHNSVGTYHHFLTDSNKLLAVAVAICSFLWFKNHNMGYSRVINRFGAATFGVLLIHTNSVAMRKWLWQDVVDCVGHYEMPLVQLVLYSISVVLMIFLVCNLIDQLRIATFEKWFFRWYDRKLSAKADALVNRITSDKNEQ